MLAEHSLGASVPHCPIHQPNTPHILYIYIYLEHNPNAASVRRHGVVHLFSYEHLTLYIVCTLYIFQKLCTYIQREFANNSKRKHALCTFGCILFCCLGRHKCGQMQCENTKCKWEEHDEKFSHHFRGNCCMSACVSLRQIYQAVLTCGVGRWLGRLV